MKCLLPVLILASCTRAPATPADAGPPGELVARIKLPDGYKSDCELGVPGSLERVLNVSAWRVPRGKISTGKVNPDDGVLRLSGLEPGETEMRVFGCHLKAHTVKFNFSSAGTDLGVLEPQWRELTVRYTVGDAKGRFVPPLTEAVATTHGGAPVELGAAGTFKIVINGGGVITIDRPVILRIDNRESLAEAAKAIPADLNTSRLPTDITGPKSFFLVAGEHRRVLLAVPPN